MIYDNYSLIFMGWQEIDPVIVKDKMGMSAGWAIKHFEQKYGQSVTSIACHPDALQEVRQATPAQVEVYVDAKVYSKNQLFLYGSEDAKHKEEEGEINGHTE